MTLDNELSFLPDGYLARKGRRRGIVIGSCVILAVAVALGTAAAQVQRKVDDLTARNHVLTSQCSIAIGKCQPEIRAREEQRRVIEHAAIAAELIENVPRSNVLAELTNALPRG